MGSQQIVSGLDDLQGLSKIMSCQTEKRGLKIAGLCRSFYREIGWCRSGSFKGTHHDASLVRSTRGGTIARILRPRNVICHCALVQQLR
jgi:hypothetical protein